ncbi:MAG: sodium:proton exchanger [Chloroflexota bacterium]|nr:MAG: sodium:proton exchanger [Chloroflexota bacterium]
MNGEVAVGRVVVGELGLIIDLAIAIGAALIGGAVAQRLRLPALLGYLIGGMIIGSTLSRSMVNVDRVQILAEIGVIFLLFTLGAEFSLRDLRRVRNVAIFGGILQILLTILLGLGIGQLFHLNLTASIFFGCLIALSSTMVAIKIVSDRGELDTPHGRVLAGFLIVQDLSVVPMLVVLTSLSGSTSDLWLSLALSMAKAVAFLIVTLVLGLRFFPWLLARVAAARSREMFVLTVVFIALSTALITQLVGLTLALGSFLAGLLIKESEYSHAVTAEVLPLRDVFSVIFFVSIGMLIDPAFIVQNVGILLSMVLAIMVGKLVLGTTITRLFGYTMHTSVLVGLGLVQIGEFSFVLAKTGVDAGTLPNEIYSLTLAGALITIVLSPLAMQTSSVLISWLQRATRLGTKPGSPQESPQLSQELTSWHVVICGYGQAGRTLTTVLNTRGFKYLVIDEDPWVIRELRAAGIPCIYGDPANLHVLAQANLSRARLACILMTDPVSVELATRNAKQLNPRLDVIAWAPHEDAMELLRGTGAREVVDPEFEAALEIVRHTLHRFGVSTPEILALASRLRAQHYEAT